MSGAHLHRHLGILRRRCPHIRRALKEAGLPEPRQNEPGFATLIRIIVDQQVSIAAGAAIWAKVSRACRGTVTPRKLLRLGEAGLRASGFSGQKARYSLGISAAVVDGSLDFEALEKADDDTVRTTLTALKGIGAWTADIYLMFAMGRPDIWPAADLGLQHGMRLLHGHEAKPTEKDMVALAERWRPYRSGAALLLWHYYGAVRRKAAAPATAKKTLLQGIVEKTREA